MHATVMFVPYFFLTRASLQHRSQKVGLYILLGMGGFVIVATIMKVVVIADGWDAQSLVLWNFVETCFALIVTCFPSLPRLIWRKPKLGGQANRSITGPGTTKDSTQSASRSGDVRVYPVLSDDDEALRAQSYDNDDEENRTRMLTIMLYGSREFTEYHMQERSFVLSERDGRI